MAKLTHNQRGFTIIESLVAIAILVGIIIAATSAAQRALYSYEFSKDQITAFYLAQEGFEQVRNIRDENLINGRNWLSGLAQNSSDPCWFGSFCTVDPVVTTSAIACGAGCPVLRQEATEGWYGYTGSWSPTRFTRQMTFTQINANEVVVYMYVIWAKGQTIRDYRVKGLLLNWH